VLALIAAGAGPRAQADRERAFADAVSEAGLRQTVRDLVALGPRMGGTPSGDRAADHLARAFEALGLDTRVLDDDAGPTHVERSWRVALSGSGALIESAVPWGFSPAVWPARAGALVVAPDLTAPGDWAGKVVYTPSRVGRDAYRQLATREGLPLAVITSAPNDPARNLDWAAMGSLPRAGARPVPVFAVSYLDGRTLASAASTGEGVRVSLDAATGEGRPRTVVATLAGRDPSRYYLVSAHGDSDSGGPGADDNASGVATVMEIARIVSGLVGSGRLPRPAVSLRFVVWGAEYQSARSYIAREGDALAGCRGVINFDETGTGAEREAIYAESNEVPWNEPLLRAIDRVGHDYLGQPGFWPEFATNPSQGGTDSYAFLPRQYKGTGYTTLEIPATTIYTAAWDRPETLQQTPGWAGGAGDAGTVTTDYSAYYHSAGDLPENTTEREPQNMVRAVKLAGLALLRLAWE